MIDEQPATVPDPIPPDVLNVRDKCDRLIRNLVVHTAQDLFMILDIAGGAEMSVPMTAVAPSGDVALRSGP